MKEDASIGSQFCQCKGARSRRVGPGMGLAHGHQTDGRSLERATAPNATLLYFRRSTDEPITGEYQPALWRVTCIHRHGCLLQQEGLHGPDTAPQVQPYGFLGNIRLIRYPDVLLMAAEAANEKG